MDFLVTMTTHVPQGTTEEEVDAVRRREAARASELAAEGTLRRLWRPPLAPGEWRTVGLFTAADADELERSLASMPLRVWRTDQVTPLASHPNDPDVSDIGPGQEFLIVMTITVPDDTSADVVEDTLTREAQRARQLTQQKHLHRLWAMAAEAGALRTLGLWNARDAAELDRIMGSLPLYAWMTLVITPLTGHPSDPAAEQ